MLGGVGRLLEPERVGAVPGAPWGTGGPGWSSLGAGRPGACGCGDALKAWLSGAGVGAGSGCPGHTEAPGRPCRASAQSSPMQCRWRGNKNNGTHSSQEPLISCSSCMSRDPESSHGSPTFSRPPFYSLFFVVQKLLNRPPAVFQEGFLCM